MCANQRGEHLKQLNGNKSFCNFYYSKLVSHRVGASYSHILLTKTTMKLSRHGTPYIADIRYSTLIFYRKSSIGGSKLKRARV